MCAARKLLSLRWVERSFSWGMGFAICAGLLAGALGYTFMYRIFALLPVVALVLMFANVGKVKEREAARK